MSYYGYIGALGLNTFNNEIEDASNTLVDRIVSDINNTSNYVWTTSNILATRINDTSNYVWTTSNIFVKEIDHTSNYVLATSNIIIGRIKDTSNYVDRLDIRLKALEGTEGSPGDVNLGIPAIPSTGAIAVAAAIAVVTAACVGANGITAITLIDMLEDKVDSNKIQSDKIGGWSSNYSDKVGVWGSNYVWNTSNILIGRINDTSNYVWNTSNILVGCINDTSNYVWNTSNILIGRINDTSNYVLNTSNILIGSINDTSNYVWNTSNILIGRINDTSNYVAFTSNILIGRINDTSNYVWNTSNILVGRINDTSNYVLNTSNILVGRINDTSNYVGTTSNILIGRINDTSNYVLNTSNILVNRIHDTSNYVWNTSNILVGRINDTSNYVGTTSNILVGRIHDTSNYVWNTSNILIGRINDTSNYVWNTSNILIGCINDTSNYVWNTSNILIGCINDTSNYVWNTSNILIGRINDTSNYVARINTELNTSDNALGVRVDNTSNYVERIDTSLGVRVDNTSNYVATKQNTLTSTALMSYFNTMDFLVANDKIKLYAPAQIGNYELNIISARQYYTATQGGVTTNRANWMLYKMTDRNSTNYGNVVFDYGNDPLLGGYYKANLNYNAGDKLQIKIKINGLTDYTQGSGFTYYSKFGLWRIATNNPLGRTDWPKDPWYYDNIDPSSSYRKWTPDYHFYQLYSWSPNIDAIENCQTVPPTNIAKYNDPFVYTLEAGYVYYFTRYVVIPYNTSFEPMHGVTYENPIMIKVNQPYKDDAFSYIPRLPPAPASTDVPSVAKRSVSLNKGITSQATPTTFDIITTPTNYELNTGFNYDETSNLISVFDGNYNNLTNKPSLITTTDINHTSNYVSRINTDLTTAIGGKAPTSHTHTIANITDLQTTLDSKAPTSHTHTIANITNLQGVLDGKAPTSHTHTIANITNLQGVLDAKQATLTSTSLDIVVTITPPNQPTTINIPTTYKPTTAGTADTLATSRNIAGVAFNGSANINIPYANLSSIPTTWTDTQIPSLAISKISGLQTALDAKQGSKWTTATDITRIYYNTGNVGIGTTNPLNIFQIGDGGRLKIANGSTDATVIGCDESSTNTKIVLSGSSRTTTAGNIDYIGSSTGVHRFYTTNATTERMRIANDGNVAIGTTDTATYKLNVSGNVRATGNLIVDTDFTTTGTSTHTGTSTLTGRVGIGKAPHATYACDVNGTINATSVLVNNTAITGSKWTTATDTTEIFYNTGNVGIGTNNPTTKLHIRDDATNTTALTIQNNFVSGSITSTPSAPTTGITGIYTYQVFTYTTDTAGAGTGQSLYTITVPAGGIVCDVLIVAGGGGGGMNAGAGGGAGGLILLQSTTLAAGNITIRVGDGGAGGPVSNVNTVASNGKNSIFGSYTAIAGGAGVNSGGANGNAGGSGGGAGNDGNGNRTGGAGTTGQGFKGGDGTVPGGFDRTGGGGGGAGGEGQASVSATRAGDGGVGRNMSSIFGTSVGASGWFAGGGGGGVHSGTGGTGGTGGGGSENVEGTNGTGGGGGAARSGSGAGRKGGSGIIIIRYITPTTSSSIDLIRGTTTDANTDYSLTNNNGDFKIISSVSGTPSTRLTINSAGNVGLGVETVSTGFILEVAQGTGATSTTQSIDFRYFSMPTPLTLSYGVANQLSVKVNGSIWVTSTYVASSDSRIKEDIKDINDDSALNMILAIKPTTYKYIDKIAKGDNKVYGFIAQQIREVIPEATSLQMSYIPNIMILADYDNEIITLPSQPSEVIIKLNDKIRCYDKDDKIIDVEVMKVIDGLTLPEGTDLPLGLRYKIKFNDDKFKYTNSKIFVYGTEIDDFHTLDKSYIFTLNVCATQELHRRIEGQKVIIQTQDERIKELELKMTDILKYLSL